MTASTLVLTARDVEALLDLPACIDAVEQALKLHEAGRSHGPTSLELSAPAGSFHVKAAALGLDDRSFIAAKANVNLPGNLARTGLPTIQGVLVLADADTGTPLALMDSIVITSLRTAAMTAIAARRLARSDAETVAVIGCGEQGDVQLRAVAAVRPIRRAFAVDVDTERARTFAARLSHELGIAVVAEPDLRAAIAPSDIVLTCTTATAPFLRPDDVRPGVFIAAVGADNPTKQELDPQVLRRGRVVVDSLAACAAGGELHHALDAGIMTTADVHGTLSGVVAGKTPGRSRRDEVFVFDSTGTAIPDAGAAIGVYTRALAAGRGLTVELGAR